MSKMIFELDDTTKSVSVIEDKNGLKSEKVISMEDFISSIVSSIDMGRFKTVKSPLYKEYKGIRLIQSKQFGPNSHVYILEREKKSAPMQYYSTMYGNVGMPKLLFGVTVVNDRLTRIHVVAVKDEPVTESTKLYNYLFSNVSGATGSVCTGMNKFSAGITEKNRLFEVVNQFFSMANNMTSYRATNNSEGLEFEQLLKYLDDKEFDDNLLVEKTDITTYGEWFDKL